MGRSHARDEIKPDIAAALNVDQWMAYGLGLETPADWIAWARGSTIRTPTSQSLKASLPAMLRRRATPIGQMAFQAASALAVPDETRFIFCSRHGEFQRTLGILSALADGEAVSPAEFSLSVHNALAGLLSIAWHNRAGHTTIAAGANSFGSALTEAASCLIDQPAEPVLLVYFEDRLTEPYGELTEHDDVAVALAMLLRAPRHDGSDVACNLAPCAMTEQASSQALAFLRFLLAAESVDGAKSAVRHQQWWRA